MLKENGPTLSEFHDLITQSAKNVAEHVFCQKPCSAVCAHGLVYYSKCGVRKCEKVRGRYYCCQPRCHLFR